MPSSGTLSPGNPSLGYTAGPFLISNGSGIELAEPACVPGACDTFQLTIDVPVDYAATHPGTFAVLNVSVRPGSPWAERAAHVPVAPPLFLQ